MKLSSAKKFIILNLLKIVFFFLFIPKISTNIKFLLSFDPIGK